MKNFTVRVGNYVIEGVEEAAFASFKFLLDQAGIDADTFFGAVKQWGADISTAGKALITRGGEVFANLGSGVLRGLDLFCDAPPDSFKGGHFACSGFIQRMLEGLGSWVGLPDLTQIFPRLSAVYVASALNVMA